MHDCSNEAKTALYRVIFALATKYGQYQPEYAHIVGASFSCIHPRDPRNMGILLLVLPALGCKGKNNPDTVGMNATREREP